MEKNELVDESPWDWSLELVVAKQPGKIELLEEC